MQPAWTNGWRQGDHARQKLSETPYVSSTMLWRNANLYFTLFFVVILVPSSPVARRDFGGLDSLNKAASLPKLKNETLKIG